MTLREFLERVPPKLNAISEEQAARRPAPGKWSKKEILGHLIDSAGNNHQRIVRAQLVPVLEFPEYEQEGWVRSQSYQTEPWADLVQLWTSLNRHLAHVVEAIPQEALTHTCKIGDHDPFPLSDLEEHYMRHVEHHIEQILS